MSTATAIATRGPEDIEGTVLRLAQLPSTPPPAIAPPIGPALATTAMRGPFTTAFDAVCAGRICTQLDHGATDLGNESVYTEIHQVSDGDDHLV